MKEQKTTFESWLNFGVSQNWVSKPFCDTHDGDPYLTEAEAMLWESGDSPCFPIIKILANAETQIASQQFDH